MVLPYKETVLADRPSNYWRLGETAGTSAVDIAGAKHGVISGGVTLNQKGVLYGDTDPAMVFNGTTGQILTAAAVPIPAVATVEAWIKTSVSGESTIVSTRTPAAGFAGTKFGVNASKLFIYDITGGVGTRNVADGVWHHAVYVISPTTCVFYVDGVLDTTITYSRPSPNIAVISLGWDATTPDFWNGSLDEVALYPYALTPAQILAHYEARTYPYLAGSYPAAVIQSGASNYWRLGEASGATAVDLIGGANGTISGGVTLGVSSAVIDGGAMQFPGSPAQVMTSASVTVPAAASVEAWFQLLQPRTTQVPLLSLGVLRSPLLYVDGAVGVGTASFFDGSGPGILTGFVNIDNTRWHHVVVTLTGTIGAVYVDGVLDRSINYARPTPESDIAGLGRNTFYATGNALGFFKGALSEIAIYPRTLTAAEVLAHYRAATPYNPLNTPGDDIAYPGITTPYPQSQYSPYPVSRPAPTLTTLTPSTQAASASGGFASVVAAGTQFTNASRVTLAGVLDHRRVHQTVTYRSPTELALTLDTAGLGAGAYPITVVNQDGQASAAVTFTVT